MENKTTIGKKIRKKRLELNIRMEEASKQAGITRSTLWSIENGKGNYSIDALINLSNVLGLDLSLRASLNGGNRNRASRINTALDKKVNRFIVMCVTQYAASVNKKLNETYAEMLEKGIIDELTDDYEDMHGMSTYSINEYIGARLRG